MPEKVDQLPMEVRLAQIASELIEIAESQIQQVQPFGIGNLEQTEAGAFKFEAAKLQLEQYTIADTPIPGTRKIRPPLPDPRLVRKIIRQRQMRSHVFPGHLFADPAWDMLLDLVAAHVEHKRVSVTSLCIASGIPSTTALRWIGALVDAGLVQRENDDRDRRRIFVKLSDLGADLMASYFAKITGEQKWPV